MAMPEPIGLREVKYLPEEINIWMYAMIGIGSAFVIFVVISVYLMWVSMKARRSDTEREALCEGEQKPPCNGLSPKHSEAFTSCESP
ncbi:UNVERIFIED_CONTAM: hypothetical protein RMT77_013300 [Armadillidium vulgare]